MNGYDLPTIKPSDMGIEGIDDYVYQDFPALPLHVWEWMLETMKPHGLHMLTNATREWPNGTKTGRGQMFVHPNALKVMKAEYAKEKHRLWPDEDAA